MEIIEDLNHFGIISDMNVGVAQLREADGDGVEPSLSVQIFVDRLVERGLL